MVAGESGGNVAYRQMRAMKAQLERDMQARNN